MNSKKLKLSHVCLKKMLRHAERGIQKAVFVLKRGRVIAQLPYDAHVIMYNAR